MSVGALLVVPADPKRADVVDSMVADVKAGILVLASVYGLPVTDEMADDRAKNIVFGLVNNYPFAGFAS